MDFNDLHHPIVAAIYKAYEEADAKEEKRGYLGASIIGAKCERYLWYIFRECAVEKFDGRMLRLFDNGNCEEARMIKDLQAIGCEVYPVNPDTQEQWAFTALGDHFSGHLDGIAQNVPSDDPRTTRTTYVAEFKTHNKRSFDDLKAMGVKRSKPKHYAQMQVYMHKMGIKKALYLTVHKDTDELYVEMVEYDQDEAEILMLRAKRIITAPEPPPRYSEDRNTFECCYCCANSICWGNPNLKHPMDALPWLSCRQCSHASPDIERPGAAWYCGPPDGCHAIDTNKPCEHYAFIPNLLPEEKK